MSQKSSLVLAGNTALSTEDRDRVYQQLSQLGDSQRNALEQYLAAQAQARTIAQEQDLRNGSAAEVALADMLGSHSLGDITRALEGRVWEGPTDYALEASRGARNVANLGDNLYQGVRKALLQGHAVVRSRNIGSIKDTVISEGGSPYSEIRIGQWMKGRFPCSSLHILCTPKRDPTMERGVPIGIMDFFLLNSISVDRETLQEFTDRAIRSGDEHNLQILATLRNIPHALGRVLNERENAIRGYLE